MISMPCTCMDKILEPTEVGTGDKECVWKMLKLKESQVEVALCHLGKSHLPIRGNTVQV